MSREAVILHADADAFFTSVEQRDDPRLRGRPTIVGSGVVMAASYEARAYGVHGGMGGRRAGRLCPQAVVVTPRFSAYVDASKALFEVFRQTAPEVEGLSMEEAFLDVRGLEAISGTPRQIAERLRRRARDELAWILGPAAARHLHAVARNRDPRRVRSGRRRGSFGSQSALGSSRRSPTDLEGVLVALVDRVTRRMRSSGRAGRTVTLRLRFSDFSRASRSRTLPHPTAGTGAILAAARNLLAAAAPVIEQRGITLLGVAVTNLAGNGCGAQLELPLDRPLDAALDAAIDEVRDRFGPDAIRRGASRARDPEFSPWLRPGEEGPRLD